MKKFASKTAAFLVVVFVAMMVIAPILTWMGKFPPFYATLGMTAEGIQVYLDPLGWSVLFGMIAYFLLALERGLDIGAAAFWVEMKDFARQKKMDAGQVQKVSVERGGFFSSTTSTVETEKGFYRVIGDVGSVLKGEPAWVLNGRTLLVAGEKFSLIKG